jgi:hypothetical protein
MEPTYDWRGDFTNAELNALHAEGFGHPIGQDEWRGQVERHSLGWVCARDGGELVGFVNVPWDGAQMARASGCQWLHADFEPELDAFYFASCDLVSTHAGLRAL